MKKYLLNVSTGLALTLLAGCETSPQPKTQFTPPPETTSSATGREEATSVERAALLQPPTDLFTLGPGDRLEIEILGMATSRTSATVGPDGKIYFQLLPGLDVWGLTLAQAKSSLERELSKYVTDPQVGVTLRAVGSKSVWLLGRFARPGIYPMAAPMTVLEAFAVAGGTAQSSSAVTTEDLGDLRHGFISRQGQVLPVDFTRLLREGDMTQNIYLRPDDFVYVPSSLAREIYVLGAVRAPHSMPFSDNATLVSAIAGAYGPIKDAYLSHVAIVRGSMSDPQITVVDYFAIVTGKSPDVRLESNDIVYVPFSPYRKLTKYLDLILASFANTVAANAGQWVVDPNATPVSPTVPLGK